MHALQRSKKLDCSSIKKKKNYLKFKRNFLFLGNITMMSLILTCYFVRSKFQNYHVTETWSFLSLLVIKHKVIHWETQNSPKVHEHESSRKNIDIFCYPTLQQQREIKHCIILDVFNIKKPHKMQQFQSSDQLPSAQQISWDPFHKVFTMVSVTLLYFLRWRKKNLK